jgi:hypothetical protein
MTPSHTACSHAIGRKCQPCAPSRHRVLLLGGRWQAGTARGPCGPGGHLQARRPALRSPRPPREHEQPGGGCRTVTDAHATTFDMLVQHSTARHFTSTAQQPGQPSIHHVGTRLPRPTATMHAVASPSILQPYNVAWSVQTYLLAQPVVVLDQQRHALIVGIRLALRLAGHVHLSGVVGGLAGMHFNRRQNRSCMIVIIGPPTYCLSHLLRQTLFIILVSLQ